MSDSSAPAYVLCNQIVAKAAERRIRRGDQKLLESFLKRLDRCVEAGLLTPEEAQEARDAVVPSEEAGL